MTELKQALDQINDIRLRVAEAKLFNGFGPLVVGLTGLLALLLGTFQAMSVVDGPIMLQAWVLLGAVSFGLIGAEMWALSRRASGANAYTLLWAMIEKFLPSLFVGAALGWIILIHAPQAHWLLPGIWQVLISIALFAARPMLPVAVSAVAAWYMVAGLLGMLIASSGDITPWSMALPFGVGQLLMALALKWSIPLTTRQV
ncbi:MAG: hypothetical protein ABJ251_17410 [Paracoccaceae bacterium]